MLEIPESEVLGRQLTEAVCGKRIQEVLANASPHGFAWFFGDPAVYPSLLTGKRLGKSRAVAGQVEVDADDATLLFNDGVNLRLYQAGQKQPEKHQLYLLLDDESALIASVQMYGGLWAYPNGANDNPYYLIAKEKPNPLTDAFDEPYFDSLLSGSKRTLSAKAFLATEQRIPGLGNGVLQDILLLSGIHPARPIKTLSDEDLRGLFQNIKQTLRAMADGGGRDTEKDLFDQVGGYRTLLSRKTVGYPCPKCGGAVQRKAYLGGNVYFCANCQPQN